MQLTTAVLLSLFAAAGALPEPTTLDTTSRTTDTTSRASGASKPSSSSPSKPLDPAATASNHEQLENAFVSDVAKMHSHVFNTPTGASKAHGTGAPKYMKAFESQMQAIESRLSEVDTKPVTTTVTTTMGPSGPSGPLTGAASHTTAGPQDSKTKRADPEASSIASDFDAEYHSILSKYKLDPTSSHKHVAPTGWHPHGPKGSSAIPTWWPAYMSDLVSLESKVLTGYATKTSGPPSQSPSAPMANQTHPLGTGP